MARDGSGNYSRAAASPSAGQTISSSNYNTELNDVAAALTASIARDGQTVPTANMPMGGFRHVGVAAASGAARTEYPATGVVQDGGPWWCGTAGGTANALTLSPTPAIAAYAAGQRFQFIAGSNNSNTVTVAVSGLSTRAIQKGTAALASGDIDAGKTYEIIYDGTAFQLLEYSLSVTSVTAGAGLSGGTITGAGTIALNVNSLTEDTSPDLANDFLLSFDASAGDHKKVKPNRVSIFSKSFVSSDQTITLGGSLALPHSLGTTPLAVFAYLVNLTGELGYTTGQLTQTGGASSNSTTAQMAIVPDATNINIRFPSGALVVAHYTTGASSAVTVGNWRLRIAAYA